ncbi:MAG: ThiF family adenylyltransferase [Limisphaerales bacterium]
MTEAANVSPFAGRFGGLARLYGTGPTMRLARAHVAVIGLGGVGSWAVEALARSGVGRLTLVDLDDVCESNVNRQLHALDGTLGRGKAEVLAERVRAIHPGCDVRPVAEFFTEVTAERLLAPGHDAVLDAIDVVRNKALLLARCRARGIPAVTCGAAGGRRDPTRLRTRDLAEATHDRLLGEVRRVLRRDHGLPDAPSALDIRAVFSTEPAVFPQADGTVGAERNKPGGARRLNCDAGYGTAAFVTGAFGLAAAAETVRLLTA